MVIRVLKFHDVSCQHLLERLPLIFVCRETKRGYYHITFVEPARRQIAQHGAHILVFERLALQASFGRATTQFAQHDVALLNSTCFGLSRLYAEGLALAYHFFCFVFELKPRFIAAPYQGAQNVAVSQRSLEPNTK